MRARVLLRIVKKAPSREDLSGGDRGRPAADEVGRRLARRAIDVLRLLQACGGGLAARGFHGSGNDVNDVGEGNLPLQEGGDGDLVGRRSARPACRPRRRGPARARTRAGYRRGSTSKKSRRDERDEVEAPEVVREPLGIARARRRSGTSCRSCASCATSEPSTNSTKEWMSDCGWITTSIRSPGRPKRKCASITSRPLFIIVAESIVILGPIFQVGCASASSTVIASKVSRRRSRKGPPEAVSTSRRASPGAPARRAWWIALCSESTGMISAPLLRGLREDELARDDERLLVREREALAGRAPRRSAERRPSAPTSPPTTVSASG